MTPLEQIEAKAKELFYLCYINSWKWEQMDDGEKSIWFRIAKAVLIGELRARVDELRKYAPYIIVEGEVKSKVERIAKIECQMLKLENL